MNTIKQGLFTPWAEVVCYPCHGRKLHGRGEIPEAAYLRLSSQVDRTPDNASEESVCDRCRDPMLVLGRPDVASLHRLRLRMGDVDSAPPVVMAQTGGMCVALTSPDGEVPILVITEDEEAPPEEPAFLIGVYADEDWDEPLLDHTTATDADVVDTVTTLMEQAAAAFRERA